MLLFLLYSQNGVNQVKAKFADNTFMSVIKYPSSIALVAPNFLFGHSVSLAPQPLVQPQKPISIQNQSNQSLSSYQPTLKTLTAPQKLFQPLLPETIPPKLMKAGEVAYNKYKKKPGACESTANHLHRILLGKPRQSVRYLPRARGLNENGKPLSYMKTLIEEHKLKPGMVIFINTDPRMKMPKLSPSNRHWFTYMGLDPHSQKPVFHDQYGTKRSLERMLRFRWTGKPDLDGKRERKLHTIFDPYAKDRSVLY